MGCCCFFPLPVSPHPGAQNVRNSAKSVLLAAKAMVSVARCCCALRRTSWMDAEGWDTAALPSSSSSSSLLMGTRKFRLALWELRKKKPDDNSQP